MSPGRLYFGFRISDFEVGNSTFDIRDSHCEIPRPAWAGASGA